MRARLSLIGLAVSAALAAVSQHAPAGTLRIVRSIDFPEELRDGPEGLWRAFALAWDGDWLNVSALLPAGEGTFGAGFLEIDVSDGSITRTFGAGGLPIRTGLTFDGTDFWTATAMGLDSMCWHTIEKWNGSDGTLLQSGVFPNSGIRPTGLAWDGGELWLLDDLNGVISRLDSSDLSVVESHPAPATQCRGLTWDGSGFWTLDGAEDRVYRIDSSGNVLATYSTPASELYGIVYDGEYLWVADNNAEMFLQLAVPEPSACVLLALAGASIATCFAWRWWRHG